MKTVKHETHWNSARYEEPMEGEDMKTIAREKGIQKLVENNKKQDWKKRKNENSKTLDSLKFWQTWRINEGKKNKGRKWGKKKK